ncbi:MAG: serine/threonine-protein kinase [Phycisphaerales bacterium]|nr:serine/threonine-protein kinase [Phycisphaerales bacterium]
MTTDNDHNTPEDHHELEPTLESTVDPTAGSDEMARRGHKVLSDILPGYVAGDEIGPFHILQSLGEGGFGVVYLAEQSEPVKRRVALKVIKPGMDTKLVIARFEAERQALALMNHPGIARVYQAGATPDHRPWFAMEYVKGVPLTDYCDTQRLDTNQRLSLFAEVCDAVQHAHQKGIIHRDLKPGNVLVAVDGEKEPSVKVIDFGIAKATSQQLTDNTILTQQGQFIGTPEYMSPEQAEMSSLDIDTRTDVYALGVILYELLAGRLPFESSQLRDVGISELLRVIREDMPPRPSTKLSSMGEAEAKAIADRRRTGSHQLAGTLQRELEWIPLKALRKDRTERYDSASALADDVRRYLAGEPLEAGPERTSYRLRKFLRRNRGPVFAACLLLLVLIAGVVVSTIFAIESTRQRRIAESRTVEAEQEAARAQAAEELAEAKAVEARQQAYVSRVHAAQSASKDRDTYVLRNHLEAIESMREGEPGLEELWLKARMDLASMVLDAGDTRVVDLAMSPEEDTLVAISMDGKLRTWTLATGEQQHEIDSGMHVERLFLDVPSEQVLCLGDDHHLHAWDLASGRKVGQFPAKGDILVDLHSDDGRTIGAWAAVPGLEAWEVLLFDHTSDEELMTLHLGTPVNSRFMPRWGGFNTEGTRLAVICPEDTVQVHELSTGSTPIELKAGEDLVAVDWSDDGKRLAAVEAAGGSCWIWSTSSGELLHEVPGVSESFSIGPTGSSLVDLWRSGVRRRDPGDPTAPQELSGHEWAPCSLLLSNSGELAISGSLKGDIRLWDLTIGDDLEIISGSRSHEAWTVSPDERLLAYVGQGDRVLLADAVTGEELEAVEFDLPDFGDVDELEFSPDSRTLAVLDRQTGIHFVDVATGAHAGFISQVDPSITTMAFHPGGQLMIMGLSDQVTGGSGHLVAHDRQTDTQRYHVPAHDSWIEDIAFDPGGHRMFTASADDTIGAWNPATGESLGRLTGHEDNVVAIDVSGDGQVLASASEDTTVRLWDAESGSAIHVLEGHGEIVWDVQFIPFGKRLLSQSSKSIVVWDPLTGEMMAGGPVPNPQFSFEGINWGDSKYRGFYGYQGIQTFDTRPRVEVIESRREMSSLMKSLSPVVETWLQAGDDKQVVDTMEANLPQFSAEEQAALRNLVLRGLATRRSP